MSEPTGPGNVALQPSRKLVFNGPFDADRPNETTMTVTNVSGRSIGFAVKTKCVPNQLDMQVQPANGLLGDGQTVVLYVTRHWSDTNTGDDDRVTVEWCNLPDGTDLNSPFDYVWLTADGMVRRKNIPVAYNL